MIKRILGYLVMASLALAVVFFIHDYSLNMKALNLSYSLLNVYLFNFIASILIYISIEVLSEKLPSQAGYGFLACVFLKIGFFVVLFQDTVFSEVRLEMYQRLSLIVPFFLFIIIESIAIAKLLNSKEF
jgi:hypothetical protein